MKTIDSVANIISDVGELYLQHTQEIPDYFVDELRRQQEEFKFNLDGFTKVASIPAALADKWLNEGFDIYTAPANEIMKRLRMEEYDYFVTAGNRKI